MLQFITDFFSWIVGLWSSLPDKTKDKIIDAVVNLLGEVQRAVFRQVATAQAS